MTALSKECERAVMIVFEACRVTGAGLATAHTIAATVAEHLERLQDQRDGYPSITDETAQP